MSSVGNVKLNMNLSIPVQGAGTKFGLTDDQIKKINQNGDEYITANELQNYGVGKCPQLTNYFVQKSSNTQTANQDNLKNAFTTNYNSGQLSPVVDGPGSPNGKVLPRLYA